MAECRSYAYDAGKNKTALRRRPGENRRMPVREMKPPAAAKAPAPPKYAENRPDHQPIVKETVAAACPARDAPADGGAPVMARERGAAEKARNERGMRIMWAKSSSAALNLRRALPKPLSASACRISDVRRPAYGMASTRRPSSSRRRCRLFLKAVLGGACVVARELQMREIMAAACPSSCAPLACLHSATRTR